MPRLCSILLLSLWIGSAASAAIVLGPQPSYAAASADDAVGFDAENSIAPAGALPATGEVSAIDGATTTSVAFDLSNPRFGIVLELARDATANASTYGSAYIPDVSVGRLCEPRHDHLHPLYSRQRDWQRLQQPGMVGRPLLC